MKCKHPRAKERRAKERASGAAIAPSYVEDSFQGATRGSGTKEKNPNAEFRSFLHFSRKASKKAHWEESGKYRSDEIDENDHETQPGAYGIDGIPILPYSRWFKTPTSQNQRVTSQECVERQI